MKAIILAGGKATRLPNSAQNLPKALVEAVGKPILAHQLEFLRKHKIDDVRLALGFRAEQVIVYLRGLKTGRQIIDYVVEPEPLGTGGAIKFASQDLKDDFLVINGDILTDLDLSEFIGHHREMKQKLNRNIYSLAAWKCCDCLDFGLIKHSRGRAVEFIEKPVLPAAKFAKEGFINAGFYILNTEIFDKEERKTFSIEQDVFPNAAKCGNLFVYLFEGFWADVGTEERLTEAQKRLKFKIPLDKNPEKV